MPSTPADGADSDGTEPVDSRDPGHDRDERDVAVETVSDLVTAVKLVVVGVALFVAALFGGALGGGGGQVAVFLVDGGLAELALGYWSLPDV
ncbi:hypothetical protein [Salinigranum marinum]|uniref:hypothetical protein n=1 Tax=Salinigranum marinum TaxID=1515595 RepID=UPI002989CD72|nr:hypothetical protein [Salinigranum marinum]